jgi:hypothetical protein
VFYTVSENDVCNVIVKPITAKRVLRRVLSYAQNTGRIPVDFNVEISRCFPAEM